MDDEQLDRIEGTLREVRDWQLQIGSQLWRDVGELRTELFGNGRPGLKADVAGLKQACAANHPAGGSALTRLQVAAGQRGRFAAEVLLPAYLPPQAGRVVVYALSPRDGGPTHLSSVDVQLNSDAPPIGTAIDPDQREMIAIVEPSPGAAVRGAVSVTARTMLVRDLVVEVRGAHNETLGRETRTLENVADLPALLVTDVPFSVTQATPGRVVVYALHARDGQTLHLSSVDVTLQP